MKIKVEKLLANPYRRVDKYPIDRTKVDSLKESIKNTDFWDNILCRESVINPGFYEIAYGHHRLTALKELGFIEIDIPVKKVDDSMMIKIMANENMDDWKLTTSVLIETVSVAKDYLDSELKKDWESLNENIKRVFQTKEMFNQLKNNGVGQTIIKEFLGNNWKQHDIQHALTAIKGYQDQKINREVVEQFQEKRHATVVMEQIRNNKIPEEKQAEFVEKVKEKIQDKIEEEKERNIRKDNENDFSGHDIKEAFYKVSVDELKKNHPERFEKLPIQKAMDFIELNMSFKSLFQSITDIDNYIKDVPYEYQERFKMKITNAIEKLKNIKFNIREVL
jgi:ParB/RepB/Spo0J family partition protein